MSLLNPRSPVLVLGIGNILLRDEGVGVRVVETLQREGLTGIDMVDGGTAGSALLELICDREKLIVVDAMQADAEPGTTRRLTLDDLAVSSDRPISLHELGILDTLQMARHLGAAPGEVVVFGVQPQSIRPGVGLTPPVETAVPLVVEQVRAECGRSSC